MVRLLLVVSLFIVSCSSQETEKIVKQKKVHQAGPKFSSKVVFEENKGWGYQIFEGSKLLINQMHIPAVQGLHYFSSKENAETTAKYILNEVEKGNFPPTVNKEILDSLNVLDYAE